MKEGEFYLWKWGEGEGEEEEVGGVTEGDRRHTDRSIEE